MNETVKIKQNREVYCDEIICSKWQKGGFWFKMYSSCSLPYKFACSKVFIEKSDIKKRDANLVALELS